MVMVIIGILASIALGKLVSGSTSVSSQAQKASMNAIAASVSTGSALNLAAYMAQNGTGVSAGFPVKEAAVCSKALMERFTETPIPDDLTFLASPGGSPVYSCEDGYGRPPGAKVFCNSTYVRPDGGTVVLTFNVFCTNTN